MKYLLVYKDIVRQIATQTFSVYETFSWHEVDDALEVSVGDVYKDGTVSSAPTPPVIPDSIFQKAAKRMIKGLMLFNGSIVAYVNGSITKEQLNNRFNLLQAEYDTIKEYIENIID